jgi:hypothetical protein
MPEEYQRLLLALILVNYIWIRPYLTGTAWDRDVKITLSIVAALVLLAEIIKILCL